jgi:carbon storage regulator
MLVLTRRSNETIVLPGLRVTVRILSARLNCVRVGIEAPPDITVLRGEVQDRQKEWTPDDASAPVRGLASRRVQTARIGLVEAQQMLAAGRIAEATETLGRIDEDLALLEGRLGSAAATYAGSGSRLSPLVVEDLCHH